MKESAILHRIMFRCSTGCSRLFRMNIGLAWVGDFQKFTRPMTVQVKKGDVMIRQGRAFRAGLKGMSDLVGWNTIIVTPEMVGKRVAVYSAIEVKQKNGRVTQDQRNFIELVTIAGGIAGVARSDDEAAEIMRVDNNANRD